MTLSKIKVDAVLSACKVASAVLMKYFSMDLDLEIEEKSDNSPVTKADKESSDILSKALVKVLNIPVLSEENTEKENKNILKNHSKFWLIDPLDGTWSYIRKKPTFAINVALIEEGVPIWGALAVPYKDKIYYINEKNILKAKQNNKFLKIEKKDNQGDKIDFLVSSQNLNQRTEDLINNFTSKTVTPLASAVKFGVMAEGNADIYPRFKPTYSWDTAAGHALLNNIGGTIINAETRKELQYNKTLLNPSFIALRDKNIYLP